MRDFKFIPKDGVGTSSIFCDGKVIGFFTSREAQVDAYNKLDKLAEAGKIVISAGLRGEQAKKEVLLDAEDVPAYGQRMLINIYLKGGTKASEVVL